MIFYSENLLTLVVAFLGLWIDPGAEARCFHQHTLLSKELFQAYVTMWCLQHLNIGILIQVLNVKEIKLYICW